jgi:hypothetical protein
MRQAPARTACGTRPAWLGVRCQTRSRSWTESNSVLTKRRKNKSPQPLLIIKTGNNYMKISFAALAALLLASVFPLTEVYAQAPPPGQPYIQIPIPGLPGVGPPRREEPGGYDREHWEHCERLRDREHELRDRLAYAPPYGEERERLEHRLREVHYDRERCRGR